MSLRRTLWRWIKPFLFRLDAETAHRRMVSTIEWTHRMGGDPLLRWASGTQTRQSAISVFGVSFASRVGLAAGFDKDAEIVSALPSLGFGFAEIGTVTPRPQPGNPKPRLFRDPSRESLFNRMGFNGAGAESVAERLLTAKKSLTSSLFSDFRVGINIGKNKDTPLEDAARDYALAASAFEAPGLVDYLVINVSSPNTVGLRSLQTIEALKPIVEAVNLVIRDWKKRPPLLLKLAPEVKRDDLTGIIAEAERWGIEGWVLTNTLAGEHLSSSETSPSTLSGGWSGRVLTEGAREKLKEARAATSLPIISVGGIMDAEEALARVHLGADLVQVYSGWVYGGPTFPSDLSRILAFH